MVCVRNPAGDRALRCSPWPPAGPAATGSRAVDVASGSAGRRAHLIVVQRQNQSLLRLLNVLRLARVVARQSGG
jgi:hypothetical protein